VTAVEPQVNTPPPEGADAHDRWLWNRRYEVIYHMRLSTLYHQKREHYFDQADKFCTLLTTVSAAAAITAILSVLQLVLNFGARSREHGKLAVDFRRLRAEAERAGAHWTEEQCADFAARALEIEAGEPPSLGALVLQCQNELAVTMGKPADRYHLRFYERWFKHFWNFNADAICARREGARPLVA
jgi:hypothetical protein